MDSLNDIVDRAIDHTERILAAAPQYKGAALGGLTKLRNALATRFPGDPALIRLDRYLSSLIE